MKLLLSIIILFIPISILAKQICIAPAGCMIEQDTGFCPKCIEVKEEPTIIIKEVVVETTATHKKDTAPINIKKPYVNDKGVRVCWFPELNNYRDCDWRERGNRTADAVKRGTRECGGFMNWEWIDEHHSKYRCNPKPEVAYTGCTWRCVVEPCSDDMLPKGCRWVGR
jgi:hypothetical protein